MVPRTIYPRRRNAVRAVSVGISVGAILLAFLTPAHSASATQWMSQPPVHHARAGLNVEQTDNAILAIGGFDTNDVTGVMEARRPDGAGAWHEVASMPTPRADFASAVVDGFVFAAGGFDEVDETNVVEKYNPRSNRWSTSRPLPQPRGGTAGASLGGRFYVAGGYITPAVGPDQLTNSVLSYDPQRDRWNKVAPMHTARYNLRLVGTDRSLYAIGGIDANEASLTTVEQYNPRTDEWRTIQPLARSRAVPGVAFTRIAGHPVLAVVGGSELVAGNFAGNRRTTEVLNIDTGRWHRLDALLDPARGGLACAIAADRSVLAIGGAELVGGQTVVVSDVDALRLGPGDLH